MSILDKLSNLPVVGNKMKMMIAEKTGGMQESVFLREYTKKKNKVDVGMYSYGGCFSNDFNNGGEVEIGRYCSFASGVHYFGANHPMDHISMSPYFYNKTFRKDVKDIERFKLTIGNDCWIGYGVIITSGCKKIGNGAVIGAGAIVTEDIPPYAIAVGAPAKVIRYRFDQETINLIENSRWWEKKPDQCMKYYEYMANPGEFCRRLLEDEQ